MLENVCVFLAMMEEEYLVAKLNIEFINVFSGVLSGHALLLVFWEHCPSQMHGEKQSILTSLVI